MIVVAKSLLGPSDSLAVGEELVTDSKVSSDRMKLRELGTSHVKYSSYFALHLLGSTLRCKSQIVEIEILLK